MSEVKMIDVYGNLPWREDGNVSFLYVEPIQNIMIAKAVNNYDRLQQENAELREALKSLHQSVLNVQLRGVEHVPSVRDRQSAMLAATKLLNKND